eukprot:TRINITY_DN9741_c0_g1_i2.p2 TRINITY_DN9741_c0_g1~~TRINITY_DN9741_c0_g1_i2.p2  ORF type:complete len:137 (-),score=21.22 TRINITY_DN9741_c0_g1_i2:85-495(-)
MIKGTASHSFTTEYGTRFELDAAATALIRSQQAYDRAVRSDAVAHVKNTNLAFPLRVSQFVAGEDGLVRMRSPRTRSTVRLPSLYGQQAHLPPDPPVRAPDKQDTEKLPSLSPVGLSPNVQGPRKTAHRLKPSWYF